ncbi:MAG TPA: DUF1801 domain-containing protein [Terrimesophilobacter sp.]|nr:DUF1801 domain-containing protein [Terrimesophilobacter sp.]
MGTVTEYIASLGEPARSRVEGLIARVIAAVSGTEEGTSYGMAALRYRGKALVSVLATKQGYSVYPFSSEVVAAVLEGLEGFDSTKGGIRFTEESPLPDSLFDAIVSGRRAEIDASLAKR